MPRTRPRHAGLSTLLAVALVPLGLVAAGAPSASAAAIAATTPTAATSKHVYVDCSAATDGNGSQSSPYNSLADVDSLSLSAGDTLSSASGYELTTSSPGLDNGAVMSSNGGRDYFGNPVSATAKPDRGAYDGPGVSG